MTQRSVWICTATLILCAAVGASTAARAAEPDPARERFPRLTRGINVGWLNNKAFRFDREAAEREARLIQAVGCRNVRLYLNIDALVDPRAVVPDPAKLPELDAAIELLLKHDLAVIVDPFHYGSGGLLKFPAPDDSEAEAMVRVWAALAKHLSRHDPERVFFEVANEPSLPNPLDWYAVETRVLAAMRENAPKHTLIAGYNLRAAPTDWDGIKALTLFPPLADRNVVYNFHYYLPMTLTHQGASWTRSGVAKLHGVPYPATPAEVEALVKAADDPQAKRLLERYRAEGWGRAKIEAQLAVAAEWAKKRGVLVTCNEFGVYRAGAPPAARAAWTRDVRESLERLGIGWTIWDGSFGFLLRQQGDVRLDEPIVQALGLKMP